MNEKVFFARSNNNMRELLQGELEINGYTVMGEAVGDGSLSSIKALAPDVVIMDIAAFGTDGIAALKQIKEDNKVEVIACSAIRTPGDVADAILAGASDYVAVPLALGRLLTAIKAPLGKKAALNEDFLMDVSTKFGDEQLVLSQLQVDELINCAVSGEPASADEFFKALGIS